MTHETNYKGLLWILRKHDHTNLRVNKCWGETYLTKLMKLVISTFFFRNTVKSSNLSQKPKFFYQTKSKSELCRCIKTTKVLRKY